MSVNTRQFSAVEAKREKVPLLIGLMGASGSGKTFSALRLATGIQASTGGDIYVIDTEARRALHYADSFKFKHIDFRAPFGSLDYLAAVEHCVKAGAGVVVIDSFSHEHDGPGGLLDYHDKELDRIAGNDYSKRERVKMIAWQKPKAARYRMLSSILQMPSNFIFCFRAKEKVRMAKVNGKIEPQPMGFMPIAGEEIVFEMTANCLLMPNSGGVPTWRSDEIGERMMMKLPRQFIDLFAKSRSLDEDIGLALSEWARGGQKIDPVLAMQSSGDGDVSTAEQVVQLPRPEPTDTGDKRTMDEVDALLATAADLGTAALKAEWSTLTTDQQSSLKGALTRRHKPRALEVDATANRMGAL